jgi:hypothetical protein
LLADELFDALPNVLVALDFDVASHEDATEPGILRARNRIRGVVHAEIAQDLGAGSVRRKDFLLSANEAFVLVEIRGVVDVVRNERVILARLRHAVDLDGEEHGDSLGLELLRKGHDGASSPAVTVQDNACGSPLLVRYGARVACTQKIEKPAVSITHAMIFECFDVNGGWIVFLQTSRDLHGTMDGVIAAHESAEEPQDDYGRTDRRGLCSG